MSRIPVPSTSPSHLRSHSPVPVPFPSDLSVSRHNARSTNTSVSMSSVAGYQSPLSETRKKQSKRDEVPLLNPSTPRQCSKSSS
jgi:hypothetical protein